MEHSESSGEYDIITQLGKGATAEVYLAEDKKTQEIVAIKIIKAKQDVFEQEAKMLSLINHENVLKIISIGHGNLLNKPQPTDEPYIVLEYAEKGDLFDFVFYPKCGFGEKLGREVFREILLGVKACHDNGIAHRDLKMENIMLDKNFVVKIADFGFAALLEGKNKDGILHTPLGTAAYAAPEVLMKKPYDGKKADIFSLGVVLFTLVTCKMAFVNATRHDKFYRYLIAKSFENYWKKLQSVGNNVATLSESFKDLFLKMIAFKPEDRISIEEIFEHPWFKNCEEKATQFDLLTEFKNREITVRQCREREKLESDCQDSNMIYRGADEEDVFFDSDAKVDKFKKAPFKNIIRFKGKCSPHALMNNFINVIQKRLKNVSIEESRKKLKFKVCYQWEENDEEIEDEYQLILTVRCTYDEEKKEYILEFEKSHGSKFDFYPKVDELKTIVQDYI